METLNKKRLGDILVSSGKITYEQLNEALISQKILGKKLGEILLDSNIITEKDMMEAIKEQTGIKEVDLNTVNFDKRVIKMIPQNLCNKYTLIPFGFHEGKLQVAMHDPLNIFAIDDINIASGFEVEVFIDLRRNIKKFIDLNYSNEEVIKAAEELSKEALESKVIVKDDDIDDIKNAPVVKMIEYMFKNSIEMRASDIHIEPYEKEVRIRYRIDGELSTVNLIGIESLPPLVARIKILAGLNIAEKRIPQDGRIITKVDEKEVDLRVSILPVVYGEKVVIRILDKDNYKVGKEHLGLSNENINIVTVEDPVEYTLEGINQVNVNNKSGMTFASGLRSILRQDPDVIMIGEIRDDETAEIAVKAAITGHLVLSTLHTNDAPTTITRLIDMGIENYLVATSVVGVIAQRLVRKICPHCKTSYVASDYEKRILDIDEKEELILYSAKGCGYCNNSGYIGRVGVYEIMEITKTHKEAIWRHY